MCVMGDLNGWLAGRLRVGKTGAFGILGENNKERVFKNEFWKELTDRLEVFIPNKRVAARGDLKQKVG